jgi:hypothetical protein
LQNITVVLVVKAVFVVLTLLGTASLWMAIAADMGASLVVKANGLWLLGGTSPRSSEPARGAVAPPAKVHLDACCAGEGDSCGPTRIDT